MARKNRNTPDAIDEGNQRQDNTHSTGKDAGGKMSPALRVLGRWPMAMIVLGMLGALTAFVMLFTQQFHLRDLVYYLPGLALSALLIFGGIGRMKSKG
jgi:hypothetical protein